MTIAILNNISLGLGAVPIATTSDDLREFEKGRIHDLDELISRTKLVYLTKDFFNTTFCKNSQGLLSTKSTLAILATPCVLTLLRKPYVSPYINPKMVNVAIHIEKYMGKFCYVSSIVNAIALISFGHLIAGYTALTIFGLDMATSFTPLLKCIPQAHKVRIAFIKYVSPFATLMNGIAIRSYLTIGFSLLGLYGILSAQRKTETKKSLPSIKTFEEFKTLWDSLHARKSELYFEMDRTRVVHTQMPPLGLNTSENPLNTVLKIFDNLNWNRKDFQTDLWDRVSCIPTKNTEEVFKSKDKENQEEKLRAKKMARAWLKDVFEVNEPGLLFFKQYICKQLLEHKELLKSGTETEQSRKLFNGLLTLIFGNGGQCQIAESMKIKEGFLQIYKSCNKPAGSQNDFLLLLNLAYKNITEQAFKDILNPILQKMLTRLISQEKAILERDEDLLKNEWQLRSLSRIHLLAFSTFIYLVKKSQVYSFEELKKDADLNRVHNFSRGAKLFGEPFNIAIDTDEVAERTFSKTLMSPSSSGAIAIFNKVSALTLGKFYWDTQLEKIIPWLTTYFENETYFTCLDLAYWFSDLLEGFRRSDNEEDINAIQEELQNDTAILGHPIGEYKLINKKYVLVPTEESLLAFAYGINLLKMKDSASFFNYIDKSLTPFERFVNVTSELQSLLQSIKKYPFIPQSMQNALEQLGNRNNTLQLQRSFDDIQEFLTRDLHEEALFFAE